MNWIFFFSALGILLWFIALLYLKSYIRRHTGAERMLENLREEIRMLEADIDQKTEQNLELLEEQIQTARKLMRDMEELRAETEKRVALYARELDRRNAQDAAFAALAVPAVPAAAAPENAPPEGSPAPRRKKAVSAKPVSGETPRGGRNKKSSLIDRIEVRDPDAAQAAGAYKAHSVPPAAAVPEPEPPEPPPSAAAPETQPPAPQPPPAAPSGSGEQPALPRFVRSPNPVIPKAPPLRERVAELYRAGFSEDLIAVRLGISITEARLYVAMAAPGGPRQD
jgi:hypothetical protein